MGRCERLKWNRRKLGMTQKELADKIGVGLSTICKLETDETAWNTIRDSTDDAISGMFRDLGSWQCDVETIFDKYTKTVNDVEDISKLRKQLKEKRLSLGLTQPELGQLIEIDSTSISKYENRDAIWKNNRTFTPQKLMDFIHGKYDTDVMNSVKENNMEESIEEPKFEVDVSVMLPNEDESIEDSLNSVIDILQDKLSSGSCSDDDAKIYVSMIVGVCNGYLQRR